ncbi:SGNH hydrolase [Delitschia confertaspora ATCC 74209]|uniref:SGNH hydrolase n=1 Tax=Delitschia confertaspora ATCC 74209 TaxID=1513339 RepID=A0A9P4JT43_9PLEO|nr:SGNH hydrolase [Delitschia confertaspora ATCC 74209]
MVLYDQFFLFGDSITQESFSQERGFGFSAGLQDAYIRRLDVINRGFSGYNTRQALKVLPKIIPSPEEACIRLMTVFFGANDASLADAKNNQHVPLEEYKENLKKIITHPLIRAHDARIILIAPGPVNEHAQWPVDKERGHEKVCRTAASTKIYAAAACEVGKELGVPVVDLWGAFMATTEWKAENWKSGDPLPGSQDIAENEALVDLMHDGLHFNPQGYRILLNETMKAISTNWPEQMPENLSMVLPPWNDEAAWKAFEV